MTTSITSAIAKFGLPGSAAGKASTDRKGALATAIEALGRPVHVFDVSGLFGPGGKPMPRVAFRVAVKAEEDSAVVLAHGYAHKRAQDAGEASEAARKDVDLLGDAKLIHALFEVCREVEPIGPDVDASVNDPAWGVKRIVDPNGVVRYYPAFPGPDWMRAHLTTDQIASLMNIYLEVRRKQSPAPEAITSETVEALGEMCRNHAGDDLPEALLAAYPRDYLTHSFVLQSLALGEARVSVETLLAQNEQMEATIAALRAELAGDTSATDTSEAVEPPHAAPSEPTES